MLRRRTALFYLLPPLLGLIVFVSVQFKTDLSAFIIAGDTTEEMLLASEMQSGTLSRRYLISISATQESKVAPAFMRVLQQQLKDIDGINDVWMPGNYGGINDAIVSLYRAHGSMLYSLEPNTILARLFTPEGLARQARFLKDALLSPQGSLVKQIASDDPLLLSLHGFQSLGEQIRQSAPGGQHVRGLVLETALSGLNAPEQTRIQGEINKVFATLTKTSKTPYWMEMTGVPVFAVAAQTLIEHDITRISVLSSVGMIVLFLWMFRSFTALAQVFSLLAWVILSAILVTGFTFGYVHGLTVAIGSTLVGICIDYPIHAIVHTGAVPPDQRPAIVARIWPSMALGGLTTIVGYLALGASGYPGFQQVAVYAGTGVITALFLTRFALPGLGVSTVTRQLNIPLVAGWSGFCERYRHGVAIVLLLTVIAAVYQLNTLRWMDDLQELTPELNKLKEKDKRVRERMLSIEPGRFILVTGKNLEAALQTSEGAYRKLDQLKQRGMVDGYFGLYPWLLSSRQQRQNLALLKERLTDKNLILWREALKQSGLSIERLGHFDYPEMSPLTPSAVLATAVKRVVDNRIVTGEDQTIIMIWLTEHQPQAVKEAFSNMVGAQYFSQRDLIHTIARNYTEKARGLLLIGLLLIVILLIGRYKSIKRALQTLLPAVTAAVLIAGVFAASQAAVSFLHLVGFLLVVSICVDYGIFYQENRSGNISLTYQAMAASMLTSTLAFSCLLSAESSSLKILASVVSLGVILGFVLCPVIIQPSDKTPTVN